MLLSGGVSFANFLDLSHAWGREKGFHIVLTNLVCQRRGEVERKRRSDLGKQLSEYERRNFKEKIRKTRGGNDNTISDREATKVYVEVHESTETATYKGKFGECGATYETTVDRGKNMEDMEYIDETRPMEQYNCKEITEI